MTKRRVFLAQVNNQYGNNVFLPYSCGLLAAYANTIPEIRDNYDFSGFVYLREDIDSAVKRMGKIDVFGTSLYIWNANYSLALARAVKQAYPDCLIVLGGPHVPDRSERFFKENPFADILVHNEGEQAFAEILKERLQNFPCYRDTKGLSIHIGVKESYKTPQRSRLTNLDEIPSPYLTGIFDDLMGQQYDYHPTQETHRGCGFSCSFCDWGSSVFTKVRKFGDERLIKELYWFAKNKVDLVYNADANYGQFERDVGLTKKMVEIKSEYGYPNKFRAAYAKNSGLRVYQISKMLNDAGMSKGTTLSFQSMDEHTLDVVKRKNIGIKVFADLMQKYREEGIPTYSEIIIGLPGETYESFANGLNTLICLGQHHSLQCYICEVLPNSELNNPEYKEKHGIKSVEVPVLFFHGTPSEDPHGENYELITSTNTLPTHDWLKCLQLSWCIQTFHCLGLTQQISVFCKQRYEVSYRDFYEKLLDWMEKHPDDFLGKITSEITDLFVGITSGKGWGVIDQRFGNLIWPPEEGAFLKFISDKWLFYSEIEKFLIANFIDYLPIATELVKYQREIIKCPFSREPEELFTTYYNFEEYLESAYKNEKINLDYEIPTTYKVHQEVDYKRDFEKYAREVVWYGRKGNLGNRYKLTRVK
jgi:radical SAM superfamily enzyme YgiQ (UPF0313 family)